MIGFNENKAVAHLAELLAVECGIQPIVAKRLCVAAALHDIGKTKIPKSILEKPDTLTAPEYEIMKMHTSIGADLLAGVQGELGIMARTIAMYHHEWYDSSQSYWGRYSCDLPAYVPIVSIADVFIALIAERVYKQAWPLRDALEHIEKQAGTQFSPALVREFISLVQNNSLAKSILKEVRENARGTGA